MNINNRSVDRGALRSRSLLAAACAIVLGGMVSAAAAAETPQSRYAMNSYCEVLTSSGISIPGHAADKLAGLTKLYTERTASSGRAAGMTSSQIAADVAHTRADVARRWAIGSERPHLTKQTEACAALPFFEAVAAVQGKKG